MNKVLSIDEKIHHIEHLLEVVLKNQQQIKNHLWRQPQKRLEIHEINTHLIKQQEEEALDYVNDVIKPKTEEIGVQGFWQEAVLNFLKQQALNFIGNTLKQLVIEKLVDLSKWLMEQAEGQIINLYNKASAEEKKTFKDKIREVYPESELLKKLA